LYYRIAVVMVRLPPLRERIDDLPLLIEEFLARAGRTGPLADVISKSTLESLERHRWPGNVRELRNFIEAALAMGEAPQLAGASTSLEPSARKEGSLAVEMRLSNFEDKAYREARDVVLREFERIYFSDLMKATNGNIALAARRSGMDRTYLGQLLKKLGL